MRSLHLCNIANVAYGYSKILRQAGHEADLRCHDLTHLMSQPEWDDLELDSEDFPDENDFTVNTADFGGYERPFWFQNAPIYPNQSFLKTTAKRVLPANVVMKVKPGYRRLLGKKRMLMQMAKSRFPRWIKERIRGAYQRAAYLTGALLAGEPREQVVRQQQTFRRVEEEQIDWLIEVSRRFGPEWHLTREMLGIYRPHACWLERHLTGHDVAMAYVFTPIYTMLHGNVPFVSIEIGTMRDLPFDGTPMGRMLALAYRLSDHIIITNPDVITQARQLGLNHYTFCPHPVDEDVFVPGETESELRREICQKYDADFVLFAPARQNWEVKGNDRYLRAFRRLLDRGARAVLLIPGWGQQIERSKKLCIDLNICHRVSWMRPISEMVMVKYYQAADLVLDQFQLGAFGLITCKALSCGKAVLTSYDRTIHDWCFPEHPPAVVCRHEEEIAAVMTRLWQSRAAIREIGQASRNWVRQHHSKRVVRGILDNAMGCAIDHFKGKRDVRLAAPAL